MSKHNLKPCPFCGSTMLENSSDDGISWITCRNCNATGPITSKYSGEEGEPYFDWNSRAEQSSAPAGQYPSSDEIGKWYDEVIADESSTSHDLLLIRKACDWQRQQLQLKISSLEKDASFRLLVAACNRLEAEAEEFLSDDGIGRSALLDYWHEFDEALERARDALSAQAQSAPTGKEALQIADIAREIVQHIADSEPTNRSMDGMDLLRGTPVENMFVLDADTIIKAIELVLSNAEYDAALAAPQPAPAQLSLPEDGAYLIRYDDTDRKDELFAMSGGRDAAIYRYKQISGNWNAHLFVKIDSNCRDVKCPNAAFQPVPVQACPTEDHECVYPNGDGACQECSDLAKLAKAGQSTPAQAEQIPWIKVSDRMPEDGEPVLGYNELWVCDDSNPKGISECYQNDGERWYWTAFCMCHDEWETKEGVTGDGRVPTHWKPIPEPPSAQPSTGGA
jgi:hypothetical protein